MEEGDGESRQECIIQVGYALNGVRDKYLRYLGKRACRRNALSHQSTGLNAVASLQYNVVCACSSTNACKTTSHTATAQDFIARARCREAMSSQTRCASCAHAWSARS